MDFTSFPHTDGVAWQDLDAVGQSSLDITPLPDFLYAPLAFENFKCSDETEYCQSKPSSGFVFSLALSRQVTPMNLGLPKVSPRPEVHDTESDLAAAHEGSSRNLPLASIVDGLCCISLLKLVLRCIGNLNELSSFRMCCTSLSTLVAEAVHDDPLPWYLPLRVRCKAVEDIILTSKDNCKWPIVGQIGARVAALLGPNLWTDRFAVLQPQAIKVILEIQLFQHTCGVGFGIVSDTEFFSNPQGSREKARYIDQFGRLNQDGIPCVLYGMHIRESDELSMVIRPFGDEVHGTFLLNGYPLHSTCFTMPRNQACSAVVFFDVCEPDTIPTRVRSPLQLVRSKRFDLFSPIASDRFNS